MHPDPFVGTALGGRYQLESLLGRGGMGAVYRARDTQLDRAVAVKRLADAALGVEGHERLLREARAAAALNHPHIVSVYDVGDDHGTPFIVMELVEGGSLRQAMPLGLPEVLAVSRQLCDALEHAHDHGIVHRDLKPENVLVTGSNAAPVAKLADLGVAWAPSGTPITTEGTMVGTASYMAPEQALGLAVDGRADLYALGVLLYELVARRLPFEGHDPLAVISQHLHAPVTPPRAFREELPPGLEAVILRLLAKDPEQRFARAREVAAALEEVPLAGTQAATAVEGAALLEQLVRGRLVGRIRELHQLRELWRHAQQRRGHVVLISGEPGAGKTRLAREAVVYARLSGAAVLAGGCYEYEATTPYLPFVEALRRWVHEQGDATLTALPAATAAELARLAPELETRLGPIPLPPALPPHEERLRLFDHVARFFQTLAARRGLLFFVDDLHWADQGTLALLHYLMRNLREEPLLVLGAYREVELDRAHPLAAALVEWNRERLATRVQLERFRREDTEALIATLLGQESMSGEFGEVVHRETEGNPFFIEEVLKSLIEQGQIYRSGGEWDRKQIHELVVPQSVKAAIGRRLDRLSPGCAEVLHTAAALGKLFSFAELSAVAPGGEDALLDALDEAVAAQLLQPADAESFAFTHDKIREVLIEELNPIRRRRLHQRIGEGLERLHGSRLAEHAHTLAFHFAESGDLERGLRYGLEAAERAKRVHALDEALGFLERARECAETLGRPEDLGRVHEAIARIYAVQGSVPDAAAHFERAIGIAADPHRRAALKTRLGEVLVRVGDPRTQQLLDEALAELDPDSQVRDLTRATTVLGRYHHLKGQHTLALECLERARRLAEPLDDPGLLGLIYSYLAGACQHLTRYEESDAWARRAIALGEHEQNPETVASGLEFLGENMISRGRWEEAIARSRSEQEIAGRIGSLDRLAWALFVESWAQLGLGRLADARAASGRCLELCERIGERRLSILLRTTAACTIELNAGELDAARAMALEALDEADALGLVYLRTEARRALATLHLRRGEYEQVLARARQVEEILEGTESRVTRLFLGAVETAALLGLGRLDEAAARAERALEMVRAAGNLDQEGVLETLRGAIFAGQGRDAEARAAFERGVRRLEETGTRIELGRARVRRSAFLRARGEPEATAEDLSRARALFEECGARGDLAAVERQTASGA